MKWIVALLIVLGFGAAISAAILVGTLQAGDVKTTEVKPVTETRAEILVASRALPAMTVIDASSVIKREVSRKEVPAKAEGSLTNVIGQVLVAPMVEGQVFTKQLFAGRESGFQLATKLPPGFRAMSTFLSTESGIEDLIYPGAIVDVIASFRMPTERGGASGEILSSTLLESVQVLAIGPRNIVEPDPELGEADSKHKRMVTLMVTPEQGEVLQLATTHGQVTLALRHPLDAAPGAADGTLLSELSRGQLKEPGFSFGGPIATAKDDAPKAKEPPVWNTVILRGKDAEMKSFPVKKDGDDK